MDSKILRINMSELKINEEKVPEDYVLLSGRALTTKIMNDEIPKDCNPLRGENKVVIAPGSLEDNKRFSCLGSLSIGAKSPLNLTINEYNSETVCGQKLLKLAIKAIIIEGLSEDNKFYKVIIKNESIVLELAEEYEGIESHNLIDLIISEYGKQIALISIGPEAENRMIAAGISINDVESQSYRYAAGGGLGAVLAAKGIKALIIDNNNPERVELQNKEDFSLSTNKFY
jgi:aldehyde:ferredoxin oxidoreductase